MTNEELKLCPFCGREFVPVLVNSMWSYEHSNDGCPMQPNPTNHAVWLEKNYMIDELNQRPIDDALRARAERAEAELARLREFHPRAAKLMDKRKNFVVVADDETYFIGVYQTIRAHEQEKGRWTNEDEKQYQIALYSAVW